jgi:imidazolonepropionase-like amidohydrolase
VAPNGGWFGYANLTERQFSPGPNIDFWLLGLQILGVASLAGGFNFIVTILNLRAPGMKMMRLPVFSWMTLVTSFLIITAFPVITVALAFLMFDRFFGTHFYLTSAGADAFRCMYRDGDGADEVRKSLREQLKAGADVIKVMATGAVMTPGEQPGASQYTFEEMSAAAEEAHKVGRKMAAHAHGSTGILTAVQAGADTIEHGSLLCESPEAIHLMVKRGVFLVPTLATSAMTTHGAEIPSFMAENDRRLGDAPQRSVRAALDAGVPIAMGTDAGVPFVRHGDNAIELVLMVESGLSPMQSIVASTSNAALALGLQDEIGRIEVGKCADLLVIDGDPLADISVLTHKERIRMVMQNGCIVVGL